MPENHVGLTSQTKVGKRKTMNKKSTEAVSSRELSHSMVHYLLAIHKLKEEKGYARVTDIAKSLDLTKGSVSTSLNNLKTKGLVLEEPDSKFLNLSKVGHDEVHKILSSRTLLYYFLKDFIGVSEETAHNDSCLMEHLMSEETRELFFKFMKKLACCCDENHADSAKSMKYTTTLDLCGFNNEKEFFDSQMGDSYLQSSED